MNTPIQPSTTYPAPGRAIVRTDYDAPTEIGPKGVVHWIHDGRGNLVPVAVGMSVTGKIGEDWDLPEPDCNGTATLVGATYDGAGKFHYLVRVTGVSTSDANRPVPYSYLFARTIASYYINEGPWEAVGCAPRVLDWYRPLLRKLIPGS